MSERRRSSWPGLMAIVVVLLTACGGTVAPVASTGSSGSPTDTAPVGTGPLTVGPVSFAPPVFDTGDDLAGSLARLGDEDEQRLRTDAGFAAEVGPGWTALSGVADTATDAAVRSIADEFAVQPPVGSRSGRLASAAGPPPVERARSSSVAAAMALIMAGLSAGQGLGSGGTREASSTSTETRTDGDEVATMTAKMNGKVVSTGSRVVADFTFELTGQVVNSATGATARMQGRATAHVEIDGCPDANGSSKGKVSLSSNENVFGQSAAGSSGAGWTRDLSGEFDISVDDDAAISGVVLDAEVNESVKGGTREAGEDQSDLFSHDLGIKAHWEASSGEGFNDFAISEDTATGEVTHESEATDEDLNALFRSAGFAVTAAAILLGREAEKFWRGGKCVELIIDPAGGDVEADSTTDVVATVRHKFEDNELDKPVEATLEGVAAIDPVGEKQPAPATVTYTAGAEEGDVGNIAFKTVSNRGIAEKTVKFTVKPAAWDVTFKGTDVEVFGPVSNSFTATITDLRITATEKVLSGTGKLRLKGTVTSAVCSGPLDQVAPSTVTGTLVGTGDDAVLRIVIRAKSPPGGVVHMRCQPSGGADIPAEGHAERFGEPLGTFDLPAVAGSTTISKTASIGGVLQVTIKGTFTVTLVTPPGG